MRLSDWPRAKNRTRINSLFNGQPPFSNDEENKINVNPLGGTVLAHDARAQFYGALVRPGNYFEATTDTGPKHKRSDWGRIVTGAVNKRMKASIPFFEKDRSVIAMDILHGIGPSGWRDDQKWMPNAIGIEDIGIPSNTLLTMENLPFFYVYRSFTVPELIRLTNRKNVDRAWNMPLVRKIIKEVDKDTQALMGSGWPEVWSPEKTAERVKGDGTFYASDQVQTINCFDFYFWNDEKGVEGWNRRMILDAWASPSADGMTDVDPKKAFSRGKFLFNSGRRKYANRLNELVAFQFADLSAVAPFRYHSVRSLGYLVYGVCHLQNRLFCRFTESAFEATMNYLRVNSPDDADRALKIDLMNRGVIDKSVEFVKQADRWQVNAPLIQAAMEENRRIIDTNSSGFTQQPGNSTPGDRKTKFQVMSEIQQTGGLVQTAFNQVYRYRGAELSEIFRRFCIKDSRDIDVREFRAECLARGVPEKYLCAEYWNIAPTQTMGDGNKTMEMAITEQLLSMRNLYDPEAQRDILRRATFNLTSDATLAKTWVPDAPIVSDTVHDAQLASAALMMGLPVTIKQGLNHKEYSTVLIGNLQMEIEKAKQQQNNMATQDQIQGFSAMASAAEEHLQLLAQDPEEKQFVNQANQKLSVLMNEVKGFAQRLQQQQQAQNPHGEKLIESINYKDAPEDIKRQLEAKAGFTPSQQPVTDPKLIKAATSEHLKQQAHTQKEAHAQVAFEQQQQRDLEAFQAEQARENLAAIAEMEREKHKAANAPVKKKE